MIEAEMKHCGRAEGYLVICRMCIYSASWNVTAFAASPSERFDPC
jgi:hypothetical protein